MLDDSVMFAKRLRSVEQPVTLCIVDDLPHGFLSLSQLSKETREAANVCVERIRARQLLGKGLKCLMERAQLLWQPRITLTLVASVLK
ncbi:hypothetical protein XENOCAPTIV_016591 [Xenoophorus captivus]|uniref:Uncharacterized protein n=1 Tax=Xenoophorus captivus TaxID=1517983 RepID=A0ABV0S996_9TELE